MSGPLNGEKLHPLSAFALGVLQEIKRKPLPRQEVNPGVVARLNAENLVEVYADASPFYKKSRRATTVQFLRITSAGEQRLAEAKAGAA
jgi:hypothetical protein